VAAVTLLVNLSLVDVFSQGPTTRRTRSVEWCDYVRPAGSDQRKRFEWIVSRSNQTEVHITVVEVLNNVFIVRVGWGEYMYASDDTVQKVKVIRPVGWFIELDVSGNPIPTLFLVRPSDDDPKCLFRHTDAEHATDLNELDA